VDLYIDPIASPLCQKDASYVWQPSALGTLNGYRTTYPAESPELAGVATVTQFLADDGVFSYCLTAYLLPNGDSETVNAIAASFIHG
jgi:hypothetical protein